MIRRVKGTQDLLSLNLHDGVIATLKRHFTHANFAHIQTPILEYADLFCHSVGEHTDIVTKEMYTFSVNSKETLCLRPEATASTMRAFLENKITQKPWNVFSYGPMFRHERPQKGRWRQFSQFNIEMINTSHVTQDARLIMLLNSLFREQLGLSEFAVRINFLGTRDDRARHKEALQTFIAEHKNAICETCSVRAEKNILRIFDCKNETCQSLYESAPRITDFLSQESENEWKQLQELLAYAGVSFIHDSNLVRGLDYYNKTVFEFTSPLLGAQSAFCGGGQYDLSAQLGHKQPIQAIGAAIGIERLLLFIEESDATECAEKTPELCAIIPFAEEQHSLALLCHQSLHTAGINSDIFVGGIKKGMKKADKDGAYVAILIGEDEQQAGTVTVKCMKTGQAATIQQGELVEFLTQAALS